MTKLTKKTALSLFNEELAEMHMNGTINKNDKHMMVEAWNNFTDVLCKDGMITDSQYNNWTNPF